MSSRLFQRVREEMALAYAVYTYQSFHADAGVHGVYVGTNPETVGQAVAAIREELARIAGESLPREEIEAGKQQLKGQVTLSMESVTTRMYKIAATELYAEPYRSLDATLALIDSVSDDDVALVCSSFFDPNRFTTLTLGPLS